jgi:prophage regulatory protein
MEDIYANNRVIRMRDLADKVGLRPSTIYELVAKGRFPRPFKIVQNGRAAGWLESEIDAWLDSRAVREVEYE